jgi:hypothetical protein
MARNFARQPGLAPHEDTELIANAGRSRFILIIFGIAVTTVGIYLVLLTPGEPEQGQTPPHATSQVTR